MRLRRKRLPPELEAPFEAFNAVLAEVEPAKAVLTEVMPTTRLPGRPLPDVLLEFEERIGRALEVMPAWRRAETEEVWGRCADGLAEALLRAQRLREESPELGGFEGLIWTVEHLMSPLDPFEAGAERFNAMRKSSHRLV